MTAPSCTCLAEQSDMLRVENTQLVLTWCSDTRQVTPTIATQEISPAGCEAVVVVPRFCPFCGVPYAAPAGEVQP
jgi:hypothetical protein